MMDNSDSFATEVQNARKQRNLTQEELAEMCGVTVRTIQRIEGGSAIPRGRTRRELLSKLNMTDANSEQTIRTTWQGPVLQLSSCCLLLPLSAVIWWIYRSKDSNIAEDGKHALNFQITMWISMFLLVWGGIAALGLVAISISGLAASGGGIFFAASLILVSVFCTYLGIINSMKVSRGDPASYPIAFRFIK